jgi:probable F420-dependent oxidoreductase
MPLPFRFGVQEAALPAPGWSARVRQIEELGYSILLVPDHFGPQWEPVAMLAAAAAVTERLRIGSLVFSVDYRHPVVLAKAAATLQLLSEGRFEFGLGAGWMVSDYAEAGVACDPIPVRIERLDEALQVIRSLWTQPSTDFEGKHYQLRGAQQAGALPAQGAPRVFVGGGGPRVLRLAGRHADIVGINPVMAEGRITPQSSADLAPQRVREKVGWMREGALAAGRDPDSIELNALVTELHVSDDPGAVRRRLAADHGMSEAEVAGCPMYLTGSLSEIHDGLVQRREDTGINYLILVDTGEPGLVERFAQQIVEPLTGK